jgi:hypothetical protein
MNWPSGAANCGAHDPAEMTEILHLLARRGSHVNPARRE